MPRLSHLLVAALAVLAASSAVEGGMANRRAPAAPQELVLDPSSPRDGAFRVSAFLETNINEGTNADSIYAELLRNRAFQEPLLPNANPYDLSLRQGSLNGWSAVGGSFLDLTTSNPLTSALPKSVVIKPGLLGGSSYGIRNGGHLDNIRITAEPHSLSFWVRLPKDSGPVKTTLKAALNDGSNNVIVDKAVPVTLTADWQKVTTTLIPSREPPTTKNTFTLVADRSTLPDGFQLQLVSLFPPTFPGTVGRRDLVQAIKDLRPQYLRLPGGNDLEGNSREAHWNWTNTIGPIESRPGRPGTWTGWNNDALGLIELMNLAEAVGATAIPGIYTGFSLDQSSVPPDQLQPYVDNAINMLHFLLDESGQWADLRRKSGRDRPYRLEVVEVGNEEFLFTAPLTWPKRYPPFRDAISREFPSLLQISASNNNKAELGPYQAIDQHDYPWPEWFTDNFNLIDGWERNSTKVFELEWAALGFCNVAVLNYVPGCRFGATAPLYASISEAVFGMGMERNGDIVSGAAYAPLLSRVGASQWTPNLIEFDASNVALSTSYYVQQGLSVNHIDKVWLSSKLDGSAAGKSKNVFVSAGSRAGSPVVKLANFDQAPKSVRISSVKSLPLTGKTARTWTLSGDNKQATNLVNNMGSHVKPKTGRLTFGADGNAVVDLPAWSFVVLTF